MIVPSDIDYQETKRIKQGKATLNPDFVALAGWISATYSVQVLNIYYEVTLNALNITTKRLRIILEFEEEEQRFLDPVSWRFLPEKQKAVAAQFRKLVKGQPQYFGPYDKPGGQEEADPWVIFDAFEPVAKIEANEGIPASEISNLKTSLNNPDIWEISRFSAGATIFFYTRQQVEKSRASGYHQTLTEAYFQLLKRYDEFGYFQEEIFSVQLDSKENFDQQYQSNWYYYYK